MSNLLSWLNNNSKLVKFVVSSVPFFPDTKKTSTDKWSGFKSQRDTIISHIQKHKIKNVVFLSGDVHCSMSAELDIGTDKNPLKIYSIISSAFYWPYPHMKRRNFKLDGYVSSAKDEKAYKLGKISEVYSSDNFTRVKVKPTGVNIEVFNRKGGREHVDDFTF